MSLSLHPATPIDMPAMAETWYSAFITTPLAVTHFPPTPICKAWFSSSFSKTISTSTPAQSCFVHVMKDYSISGSSPGENAVAFARWFIFGEEWSEDWKERYVGTMPEGISEEFMGGELCDPMARQHRVLMGRRRHFFLEILATRQEYQGKGLGSKLLKKGLEMADEEGLEVYLDASKVSKGLYEKYGFVEQEYRDPMCKSTAMIRPAKGREGEDS